MQSVHNASMQSAEFPSKCLRSAHYVQNGNAFELVFTTHTIIHHNEKEEQFDYSASN